MKINKINYFQKIFKKNLNFLLIVFEKIMENKNEEKPDEIIKEKDDLNDEKKDSLEGEGEKKITKEIEVEISKQIVLPLTQDEYNLKISKKNLQYKILANSIKEEIDINELNKKKLLMNWRKITSELKKEGLKENFNILESSFKRTLEAKNKFLDILKIRLNDSKKQYEITLKNHILHTEKFDDLRKIKIKSINENFDKNLKILNEEFENEYKEIMKDTLEQKKYLKDMIETIKEEEIQKCNIVKENFQQLKEEAKDKTNEQMELMQTEMNTKKVNIYNALENLFQKFMNDTKEKFKKYTNLMKVNTADSKAIEETIKRISKTKNRIKLTSLKIIQMKKEFEDKNLKIKKENDEIAKNFLALKNKMFKFREKERKKLTFLVCNTKKASEKLKKIYKLGEKLLKVTELCRKLEFKNEKITPFIKSKINEEKKKISLTDSKLESIENLMEIKEIGKFDFLNNYLKRYNKVLLDTLAIKKEKEELKNRNKDLKNKLLKYMDGLTISKFVLDKPENKLLITTSTLPNQTFEKEKILKKNYVYNNYNKIS